jgi:hypothetical protein
VRRITIACLAAVFGCAAPTHEKMSWAEAMPLPAPRPHKSPPKDPLADPAFEAALQGFQDGAQAARKSAENGAAMAAPQVQAWDELLGRVDAFLQKAPGFTSLLDAAKARAVVEGELELDAQAYGDIPSSTAQGAQAAAKRLGRRVHDLLALQQLKRVSPLRFVWPVSPVVITSPLEIACTPSPATTACIGAWTWQPGCLSRCAPRSRGRWCSRGGMARTASRCSWCTTGTGRRTTAT